jgi:hypothetical protein
MSQPRSAAIRARPFAQQLLADGETLQKAGLNLLDTEMLRMLLERHERERSNPYAQEIAAWLRGEYIFDPGCLTLKAPRSDVGERHACRTASGCGPFAGEP